MDKTTTKWKLNKQHTFTITSNMAKAKQSDLDAWGDHVEEYSKRQKQLHQELVNRKLMEQELQNTTSDMEMKEWAKGKPVTDEEINELRKQFKNNTIQTQPDVIWTERKTNNITWTENKRWMAAVIGLLCVVGFISVLFVYNLFWYAIIGVLSIWLLGVMLAMSKDIVDDLIDTW